MPNEFEEALEEFRARTRLYGLEFEEEEDGDQLTLILPEGLELQIALTLVREALTAFRNSTDPLFYLSASQVPSQLREDVVRTFCDFFDPEELWVEDNERKTADIWSEGSPLTTQKTLNLMEQLQELPFSGKIQLTIELIRR